MPNTLPPVLPTLPSKGSTGSVGRHAQDFSVTKLQQHEDVKNARVSIGQAMRVKAGDAGPTTSIGRAMGSATKASVSISDRDQGETPTTSVSRGIKAKHSVYDQEGFDGEGREEMRYDYMRRLMRQRQAKERELAKKAGKTILGKEGNYKMKLGGTGVSFTRGTKWGFRRNLQKFIKQNRQTFKNISSKDAAFFEDLVSKHASSKTTGDAFTYGQKRKMKMEIENARRGGQITFEDAKDFKKLVDNFST